MTKQDNARDDLITLTEVRSSYKTLFKLLEKVESGQEKFGNAMVAMDGRVKDAEVSIAILKSHASKLWTVTLLVVAALLTGYFTDVFQRNALNSIKKEAIKNDDRRNGKQVSSNAEKN